MNTTTETMPVASVIPPVAPINAESAFALAQRKAMAFSNSSLVPQAYRGREGMPNVLIALELAERLGASPLLVMQNLYIVQGKPGWSSSFLIATVNACGRFTPLRFEVVGSDPQKPDYKVRAIAQDKESGHVCTGPWITWEMVKAEGWLSKNGSKWKTLPELMFMYRAAGFWTRVYAPEVSMGILTREEVEDVWGDARLPNAPTEHGNIKTLEAELADAGGAVADGADTVDTATGEVLTAKQIRGRLTIAESIAECKAMEPHIDAIPDDDERNALNALYDERVLALRD